MTGSSFGSHPVTARDQLIDEIHSRYDSRQPAMCTLSLALECIYLRAGNLRPRLIGRGPKISDVDRSHLPSSSSCVLATSNRSLLADIVEKVFFPG